MLGRTSHQEGVMGGAVQGSGKVVRGEVHGCLGKGFPGSSGQGGGVQGGGGRSRGRRVGRKFPRGLDWGPQATV